MDRISRAEAIRLTGIEDMDADGYLMFWRHKRCGVCGLHRLLYHWTVHVGVSRTGYRERYCYYDGAAAIIAFDAWDGIDDPVGWHRHPTTGRRVDEAGAVRIAW